MDDTYATRLNIAKEKNIPPEQVKKVQVQSRIETSKQPSLSTSDLKAQRLSLAQKGNIPLEQVKGADVKKAAIAAQPPTPTVDLTNYVKLDTGEYVSKQEYQALSSDEQAYLKEKGTEAFNAKEQADLAAFKEANIELDTGEYIDKETFESLSPENQEYLKTNGIEAYNQKLDNEQTQFYASNVKLNNGDWVDKDVYDSLSAKDKIYLRKNGVDAYIEYKEKEAEQQAVIEANISASKSAADAWKYQFISPQQNVVHLADGSTVSMETYQNLPPEAQKILLDRGVDGYNEAVKSGEISNALLSNWVQNQPEGSDAKLAYDWAIQNGNSPEKAAQYAAQYVNALIATAQPVEAQVLDYVRSQPEGSDIKIAYNYALESGNSPEKAAQYAVNYAETMFITSPEGIQAQKVAAIIADLTTDENGGPKVVDLNEATQRLRAENIIDDTMEVTGYGGNGFTISGVKVETPQGTVLQPIIEYFDANPNKINSGDSVSDLLAMGFTLQQIADASNAYAQIIRYREQQEALAIINQYATKIELSQYEADEQAIRMAKGFSILPDYEYDITTLAITIKNNPDNGEQILANAGFNDNVIKEASELSQQNYDPVAGFYRVGTEPSLRTYLSNYISQNSNLSQSDIDSFVNSVTWTNSIEAIVDKVKNIFKVNTPEFKELSELVILGSAEYSSKFGLENFATSQAGEYLGSAVSAARVIKPDIIASDISAEEWATSGLQVGLLAVPVISQISPVLSAALLSVSGGYFTAQTINNWDDMTPLQRVIAVSSDVLLFVGAGLETISAFKVYKTPAASTSKVQEAVLTIDDGKTINMVEVNGRWVADVGEGISDVKTFVSNLPTRITTAPAAIRYYAGELGLKAVDIANLAAEQMRNVGTTLVNIAKSTAKTIKVLPDAIDYYLEGAGLKAIDIIKLANKQLVKTGETIKSDIIKTASSIKNTPAALEYYAGELGIKVNDILELAGKQLQEQATNLKEIAKSDINKIRSIPDAINYYADEIDIKTVAITKAAGKSLLNQAKNTLKALDEISRRIGVLPDAIKYYATGLRLSSEEIAELSGLNGIKLTVAQADKVINAVRNSGKYFKTTVAAIKYYTKEVMLEANNAIKNRLGSVANLIKELQEAIEAKDLETAKARIMSLENISAELGDTPLELQLKYIIENYKNAIFEASKLSPEELAVVQQPLEDIGNVLSDKMSQFMAETKVVTATANEIEAEIPVDLPITNNPQADLVMKRIEEGIQTANDIDTYTQQLSVQPDEGTMPIDEGKIVSNPLTAEIEELKAVIDADNIALNKLRMGNSGTGSQAGGMSGSGSLEERLSNYGNRNIKGGGGAQDNAYSESQLIQRIQDNQLKLNKLQQQLGYEDAINRDLARIKELNELPPSLFDDSVIVEIEKLQRNIQMNRLLLDELVKGGISSTNIIDELPNALMELGYTEQQIAELTISEKLNIVANNIKPSDAIQPVKTLSIEELMGEKEGVTLENIANKIINREPLTIEEEQERVNNVEAVEDILKRKLDDLNKPPQDSGGGGGISTATKVKPDIKVETKPKEATKVETETEKQADVGTKTETKVETETQEAEEVSGEPQIRETGIGIGVNSPRTVDPTLPEYEFIPYYAVVWENGHVFVKLITDSNSISGYVKISTNQGDVLIKQANLDSMTYKQAYELANGNSVKSAWQAIFNVNEKINISDETSELITPQYINNIKTDNKITTTSLVITGANPDGLITPKLNTTPLIETKSIIESDTKTGTEPTVAIDTGIQMDIISDTTPSQSIKTNVSTGAVIVTEPDTKIEPKEEVAEPIEGHEPETKVIYPLDEEKEKKTREEYEKEFQGSIGWRQGFGWWFIKPPYKTDEDKHFFYGEEPPAGMIAVEGGAGAAYRSIQASGAEIPDDFAMDLGIMDVKISKPSNVPGAEGAITFTEDKEQSGKKQKLGALTFSQAEQQAVGRKGSTAKYKYTTDGYSDYDDVTDRYYLGHKLPDNIEASL